jgi:hypothetical protein
MVLNLWGVISVRVLFVMIKYCVSYVFKAWAGDWFSLCWRDKSSHLLTSVQHVTDIRNLKDVGSHVHVNFDAINLSDFKLL